MTNFDPSGLDWTTGLLAGWEYDKPINKWFQGQFRRAHRLIRPCPTCSETIVLDVTAKALNGDATNHGLALRRCKKCREALKHAPTEYAERKALGAERRAADPEIAENERLRKEIAELRERVAASAVDVTELAQLRSWQNCVREELKELDALRRENAKLRTLDESFDAKKALEKSLKKLPWEA